MQKEQNKFKRSEAMGQIMPLPEVAQMPEGPTEEISDVLENPEDFRMAIGQAQMEGKEYVEVSDKLFHYLVKNNKTNYLTYGAPGIKVFRKGTRDEILSEERMNAETYHEHITKKRAANAPR